MRQRVKRSDCSPFSHGLSRSDLVLFEYLKRNDLYDRGRSFRKSEMWTLANEEKSLPKGQDFTLYDQWILGLKACIESADDYLR